jgi:hypothetical protein
VPAEHLAEDGRPAPTDAADEAERDRARGGPVGRDGGTEHGAVPWAEKLPSPPLPAFPIDDGRYLELWERSPQRTPFSHPTFARALAEAYGLGLQGVAVEDDGALVAAVSAFEKRRGPLTAAALPPLCPVHAPVLAGPLRESEVNGRRSPLDRLIAEIAGRYDQATLALPPSYDDVRPFTWAGWNATPRYTHQLRLDGDLAAGFSGVVRRTVRQEQAAFVIEEDVRHAEAAIALTETAYQRRGEAGGIDGPAARRLAEAVMAAGLVRAFAAVRRGASSPEAAVLVATDGRTAYDWIAGSAPGPAMAVLLADVLGRLQRESVEAFDFAGANVPGIAEFKRKFGGRLTTTFSVRTVTRPALRMLDRLRP